MHKTATVNARMEPKLKAAAESILDDVGLTAAEAVRLLYKQICLNNGLPFEVKIPNRKTQLAMEETASDKTHRAKKVRDLFKDL